MTKARDIHAQSSAEAQSGNFLKALQLSEEAMLAYQKENDTFGFAEIQAMRFIIFKHLYEKTTDKKYAILARNAAHIAVELAQLAQDPAAVALPYLTLGKAYELEEKYSEAAQYYKKALDTLFNNPSATYNKKAIQADIKAHHAYAEYKSGDTTAYNRMLQAITEQETATDMPDFEKHAWLSGAHLRSAEMLKNDQPQKAREHLTKAKEIIDSDQRLTLRKGQWEKLAAQFN